MVWRSIGYIRKWAWICCYICQIFFYFLILDILYSVLAGLSIGDETLIGYAEWMGLNWSTHFSFWFTVG
ncbi:hypothetical protein BGX38DRAFT_1230950 [Terfezia claveryi]|nr:hypothetical protein BGX38DRAFT_1230950 [Terfezia claveryi]